MCAQGRVTRDKRVVAVTVITATEDVNKAYFAELAKPHFDVHPEAWVREPMRGITARIDFLAIPHERLTEGGFPFDVLGVEVKRAPLDGARRRHALGQCISYRNCVIIDRRVPAMRGWAIPCVALYAAGDSYRGDFFARAENYEGQHIYGEVRVAATQNVGLFVHHRNDGLTLEIADEAIWCERRGVTGVGANWPTARRFANSNNRKP
jgi:hypothetical protein